MVDKPTHSDFESWYPTYGILTAGRILDQFNIKLDHVSLIKAVKNPRSIYYELIKVPLKNVFSGIIMEQAQDYQCYVQQLFVDYFISGQADAPEGSPGENIRESLEDERVNLQSYNAQFQDLQSNRRHLIADTQKNLKQQAQHLMEALSKAGKIIETSAQVSLSLPEIKQAIQAALSDYTSDQPDMLGDGSAFWTLLSTNLKGVELDSTSKQGLRKALEKLNEVRAQVDETNVNNLSKSHDMIVSMNNERKQFYSMILRVKDLVSNLPEYRDHLERAEENLSTLDFDQTIGEEK